MIASDNNEDFSPITHINGLPIIVGLFVSVILIVLAAPPTKHELILDYPLDVGCCEEPHYKPVVNKIEILEDGAIRWNGKESNLADIQKYLRQTKTMNPEPELHFEPAPNANYKTVMKTVTMIQQSDVTRLGWIGNEQYRHFTKAKRP